MSVDGVVTRTVRDTARFYAEQLLPQAGGLLPSVTAGARDLFALPADRLHP